MNYLEKLQKGTKEEVANMLTGLIGKECCELMSILALAEILKYDMTGEFMAKIVKKKILKMLDKPVGETKDVANSSAADELSKKFDEILKGVL